MNSVDTPSFFKLDRRYFPSSSLPCRASNPVCTVQNRQSGKKLSHMGVYYLCAIAIATIGHNKTSSVHTRTQWHVHTSSQGRPWQMIKSDPSNHFCLQSLERTAVTCRFIDREKKFNVKCGKIGPKACPSPVKEGLLSRLWYGCTETIKSQTKK